MLTHEVARVTGLTRKAIYYYVNEGLVSPETDNMNNYRNFTEDDVNRLMVISQLRKMGVSIAEIKTIFSLQHDERLDLVLHTSQQNQIEKMTRIAESVRELSSLLNSLPPNARLSDLDSYLVTNCPVPTNMNYREHFGKLFPGHLGRRYALLIWEAYLDNSFSTTGQWQAWHELVDYIDDALSTDRLSGYESVYGVLSERELKDNYDLRKLYVTRINSLDAESYKSKVDMVVSFIEELPESPRYLRLWKNDFDKLVLPIVEIEGDQMGELLATISPTYVSFQEQWDRIVADVEKALDLPENHDLITRMEEAMDETSIIVDGHIHKQFLIHFDFFVHSLYLI